MCLHDVLCCHHNYCLWKELLNATVWKVELTLVLHSWTETREICIILETFFLLAYLYSRRGHLNSRITFIEGWELPCGCQELSPAPLVLLSADPSLQPLLQHFHFSIVDHTVSLDLCALWVLYMVGSPGAVGRTRVKQSHLYDCLSGAGQYCSLGIWGGSSFL